MTFEQEGASPEAIAEFANKVKSATGVSLSDLRTLATVETKGGETRYRFKHWILYMSVADSRYILETY
jgi:hypothetical protein